MADLLVEIIAKNPPTALIAGGVLLKIMSLVQPSFDSTGTWLLVGGFVLQVLYLLSN